MLRAVRSLFLLPLVLIALPALADGIVTPGSTGVVVLRFSEESGLRQEEGGTLSPVAGAAEAFRIRLAALAPGARLERRFSLSSAALDGLRARARTRGEAELVDLNRYAKFDGSALGIAAATLAKSLAADPAVDLAWLEPVAVPAALGFDALTGAVPALRDHGPRTTPDYSGLQGYLNDAPEGVGAWSVDGIAGARGATVSVVDIEGAWLWSHEDLPAPLVELGGVIESLSWRNHGTAVLGEIRGEDNTLGVRGIAPDCAVGCSSIAEQSVGDAILNGAAAVDAGDILLIELHAPGPNSDGNGQFGYLPMEFWQDNFDAIRTVTALGVIVCEAAGNGSQDLDDPIYMSLFDRDVRDSGAIMCGATNGSSLIPAGFTNYGSRVDLHGWGYYVTTCGYGGLQGDPLPEEEWYTDGFSGTSSASPIVVGAVAALQGMVESAYGFSLNAHLLRDLLVASGTPQEEPARHIGPRPDLVAAWALVDSSGLGRVSGTVTDAISGAPLAGVDISVNLAQVFTVTDAAGHYELVFEAGSYNIRFNDFFHDWEWELVDLSDGDDVVLDMALTPLELVSLSGTVVDETNQPLADVHVQPQDVPLAGAWTDADGVFELLDVPQYTDFPLSLGGRPGHGAIRAPGWMIAGLPDGGGNMGYSFVLADADYMFEADDGGFTTEGDPVWSWDTPAAGGPPTAFSGAKCWGVGMSGDYGDDQSGSLISPAIDLSGFYAVSLSFHIWRGTESGFDGVRLQVEEAGNWYPVEPQGGYTDIILGGLGNAPGWSGVSVGWEPVEFFVTSHLSGDFRFRLDFGSDGGVVGEGFWLDDVALFTGSTITPVEEPPPGAAARASLHAWPNPFNPATTIQWQLPAPGPLRVEIYDARGRRVRGLFAGVVGSAAGTLRWDGRDDAGRPQASGLYLLRLRGEGDLSARGRVLLLK